MRRSSLRPIAKPDGAFNGVTLQEADEIPGCREAISLYDGYLLSISNILAIGDLIQSVEVLLGS